MGYFLDNNGNKWINIDENGGNKIMPDGSIRSIDNARVWNDILGDLFSKKLYTNTGKVDYNWDDNLIKFQKNGDITNVSDRIQFNFQLPHSTYLGDNSNLKLHIHWLQDTSTSREFTIRYRIQHNGSNFESNWNETTTIIDSTSNIFNYVSGSLNQITNLIILDISNFNVSDIIQFQFTRSDSNSGNMYVSYIDGHIEIDSDGSQTEYTK